MLYGVGVKLMGVCIDILFEIGYNTEILIYKEKQ